MKRLVILIVSSLFGIGLPPCSGQVSINEAVNSNSNYEDQDGATPDWLELYNAGPDQSLAGWTLTDDVAEPTKWSLPTRILEQGEHLLIWASGKDRQSVGRVKSLVAKGNECRYLLPDSAVPSGWADPDFDDSAWQIGINNLGNNPGNETDTQIPAGRKSVFIRHEFEVEDAASIYRLVLDMDFEAGTVIYLNGETMFSFNLRPGAAFSTSAGRENASLLSNGRPLRRSINDELAAALVDGRNVLAMQVHTASVAGSTLHALAYLTAFSSSTTGANDPIPEILGILPPAPHTNFRISSEGETLYLFDNQGTLVSELAVAGVPPNVSAGYSPDGSTLKVFAETTPGGRNSAEGRSRALFSEVEFSLPGGTYSGEQSVSLSGAGAGETIRYTTDASIPTESSPIYQRPFVSETNQVIRARIFAADALPSPIYSETYIVEINHDIDVLTLVTEPDNLFHPVTGIYSYGENYVNSSPFFGANFWQDKEVPVQMSFYPKDNGASFAQDLGIKIFGNYSRASNQRSFSLFARGRYGDRDMDYPFFEDRPYDEYTSLVIRNSGTEWLRTMLRDATLTGLMEGSSMDYQAYRPIATYINGEYWGLYNLREKVNEDYLASRHGIHPDSIDLLVGHGSVIEGSNEAWFELYNFVNDNDISSAANYAFVTERIDVENFILFQLAQIYWYNRDWPANNNKYYRPQTPGGKWRWIMYDTDLSSGFDNRINANANSLTLALAPSGTSWPNPAWSTLMLRKLVGNQKFRHQFINQFADEMNTRFLPDAVVALIDANADKIASEIPRAFSRWGRGNNWSSRLNDMRNFFRQRPPVMKSHIQQRWGLPGYHAVTVQLKDTSEGYVELNSLELRDTTWTGDYFQSVPIRVKAVAKDGFRFSHWEVGSTEETDEIVVDIQSPHTFRPVFTELPTSVFSDSGPATRSAISGLSYGPNPLSEMAYLRFTLSRGTRVSAQLYDAFGREVITFADRKLTAGPQTISADARTLPAGAYWLTIKEDGVTTSSRAWIKR